MTKEQPVLLLCSPSRQPVCVINGIDEESVSLVKRSNNTHELTFDVHKYIDGELTNGYEWIEEQMELYLDGIWYCINYPPSISYDSYEEIKSVTAESDEIKLQQYMLTDFAVNIGEAHSYEYMYKQEHDPDSDKYYQVKFYNKKNKELSLLHIILEHAAVPGWKIGYVDNITVNPSDNETLLPDEVCYFDIEEQSVYSFLTQEIATTCRCVFEFDTDNMLINVYRAESLGKDTNILIDFHNIQNSISISRDAQLVTVFNVQGDDDVGISYVNPVGGSLIEDLSYYCKYPYMTQELIDKYKQWVKLRDSYVEPYYELTVEYHKLQDIINELTDRVPVDTVENDWTTTSEEDLQQAYMANIAIIAALESNFQKPDGTLDLDALKGSEDWSLYESIRNYTIPAIVAALQNKGTVPSGTTDYGLGNYIKNPVPVSLGTTWQTSGEGTFKCVHLTEHPDYGMESSVKITSTSDAAISQKEIKTSKGTKYCISVYVRPTTANTVLEISYQDSSLTNTSKSSTFKVEKGVWQRVYCSFDAGTQLTDVTFKVQGKGTAYLTGMQMELGDTPKLFTYYIYGDSELKSYETDWKLYGVDELEAKLTVYQNNIDIMTSNGYSVPWSEQSSDDEICHTQLHQKYLDYEVLRDDCKAALEERKEERAPYESSAEMKNIERSYINSALEYENFGFTEAELFTLNSLKNQQTYTNPNIVSTSITTMEEIVYIEKELYDDAMDRLYVEAHPQYQYSDTIDNILALPEFQDFNGELDINNFVRVAIDDSGTYVKLRIIEMTYNPFTNENDLQIAFSNMTNYRSKRDDLAYLIDDVANASSKGQIIGNTNSDILNYILSPEVIAKLFSSSSFQTSLNGATVGTSGSGGTVTAKKVVAEFVKADRGEFGTITAETGFFQFLEADVINTSELHATVAEIDKLLAGEVEAGSVRTINLSAKNATIENDFITNGIAAHMTIADLGAASVLTKQFVLIGDNDKPAIAFENATQQFFDSNGVVRVQIGQDAKGNFSFCLYGSDGKGVLIDETGIQKSSISDKLIVNDMIDDATITADKLSFKVDIDDKSGYISISSIYQDGKSFSSSYGSFKEEYDDFVKDAATQYSIINQTAETIELIVGDSSGNSSSLTLTETMIEAITKQFVVKGPNGQVIIKDGVLAANALKSNNYSYTSGTYSDAGTYFNLSDGSIRSQNFRINSSGNVYVTGTIHATAGDFTGDIKSGSTITCGNYFSVTSDGTLTAKSGSIGGWTIATNALYNGTSSMSNTTAGIYLGTSGIRCYNSETQYVNIKDGKITAYGASITGTINATTIKAQKRYAMYFEDANTYATIIGAYGWGADEDGLDEGKRGLTIGPFLSLGENGYSIKNERPGIAIRYNNTLEQDYIQLKTQKLTLSPTITADSGYSGTLAAGKFYANLYALETSKTIVCGSTLTVGSTLSIVNSSEETTFKVTSAGVMTLAGKATIGGNLSVDGTATVGSALTVNGKATIGGNVYLNNCGYVYGKTTDGENRHLISMNSYDIVQVGSAKQDNKVHIYGETVSSLILRHNPDGSTTGEKADFSGGYNGGVWTVRTCDNIVYENDNGYTDQIVFSGDEGGYFFRVPAVYARTTSTAPNVFVNDTGTLARSTSASKYKLNIKGILEDDTYAYNALKLSPMQWNDKSAVEQYASYLTRKERGKTSEKDNIEVLRMAGSIEPQYGLIAEHVEQAGLSKFCHYTIDDEGNKTVEGIMYDRLCSLNIPISRDLVFAMQIILPVIMNMISDKGDKSKLQSLLAKFNSIKEEDIITA